MLLQPDSILTRKKTPPLDASSTTSTLVNLSRYSHIPNLKRF